MHSQIYHENAKSLVHVGTCTVVFFFFQGCCVYKLEWLLESGRTWSYVWS